MLNICKFETEIWRKMNKTILIAVITTLTFSCFAQEEGWMTFPAKKDSAQPLDFGVKEGKVIVHEDERIKGLQDFVRSGEETLEGVLIEGYRVMIYFDQNKSKSESEKLKFMNRFSDHKTYIDYLAPNYRVRVGNFRTKLEAEKLKQEILNDFPTCVVVSDKIQLPELKK